MEDIEQKSKSWEQRFHELQRNFDEFKQKQTSSKSESTKKKHPDSFWQEIYDKLRTDADFVKSLIRDKTLTLNDVNEWGQNLLSIAAERGAYEVVQFCLNLGADINETDDDEKSPLDLARESGYYHVEQLLLFSQMNVNIGNEIKNTSDIIHKQNGINQNIFKQLSLIGNQSKELFEKILMELMINVITEKLSFSDHLLNLCWNIVSRNNQNPLSSDLWKSISSTCSNIIQKGTKRDWYWLKTCIIPSAIWFNDISEREQKSEDAESNQDEARYLYFELLKLVDIEAKNQLNKLEQDLNKLAAEHQNDWDKLTKWDITDEYDKVRQDVIPNGIISQYSYEQLSANSGALFNSPKFYDYNQYLSQLVLLAQIVDDDFQRSIQDMFKIDLVTNEGIISFDTHYGSNKDEQKNDDDIGDGIITYSRGPVKLIERARNKAQNDYSNEDYPASACILDLNRCALVFNDISTLLTALELFVNKVKYYQSGNIIGVVRDKNGFIEYVKNTQYADIKLNVLIKGKHNNLIGEVQFLLKTMKEFKDKAHNLYAIQRQQESIETSVSKVLPMLLDEDKQLFIAGNRGNVKDLCKLMVINNKTEEDIMKIDKHNEQTILHRICSSGHYKAFLFLKSILSKATFIKYVLMANDSDQRPVEFAVRFANVSIVKNLFEIKEIRDQYKNKNELFRLCYFLFAYNKNTYLIDHILGILKITNKQIIEMINYKYPQLIEEKEGAHTYHLFRLLVELVSKNRVKSLKKLISIIGEKIFIQNALISDKFNKNCFEEAIAANKMEIIRYILSFKEIKDQFYNNDELLFRLIYFLFAKCSYLSTRNYVLSELSISNDIIKRLITYEYREPAQDEFVEDALQIHRYSILAMAGIETNIDLFKDLCLRIGDKVFIDAVFMKDGWGDNALQAVIIENKVEIVRYILNKHNVKQICVNNQDEIKGILSVLNENSDEEMVRYIVNALQVTEATLNELQEEIDIEAILNIVNKN